MAKKTIEETVGKKYPDFKDEVDGLSTGDLEARLTSLAKGRQETRQAQDDDLALEESKARTSELGAPYSDTLKEIDHKSRYIAKLIKEKGGK